MTSNNQNVAITDRLDRWLKTCDTCTTSPKCLCGDTREIIQGSKNEIEQLQELLKQVVPPGSQRSPESDKFWRDLIYKDGKLDEESILNELADFSFVIRQVSKVYEHVTGGVLSKIMYHAEAVIVQHDDKATESYNEAYEEGKKDASEEFAADIETLQSFIKEVDDKIQLWENHNKGDNDLEYIGESNMLLKIAYILLEYKKKFCPEDDKGVRDSKLAVGA